MIIVTFALITQLKNGSLSVSRHKPPDLYNNTRIRASDLTPEVWNVALVAKGGLLTYSPVASVFPTISVTSCLHRKRLLTAAGQLRIRTLFPDFCTAKVIIKNGKQHFFRFFS